MRPIAIATLAFLTIVVGCKDKKSGASGTETSPSLPPGGVLITANEQGFKPSAVTFKKGAPAALVFLRTSDDTCATEVKFEALNITKDLPKGKPVTIDIPTDKDQTLTFSCGMGMYKSSVVVN